MRIAITGVTGVRNRGVEALVDTALTEMQRRWPSAEVTVLTSDRSYDRVRLPGAVKVLEDASRFFGSSKAIQPAIRAILAARSAVRGGDSVTLRTVRSLNDADVVVALGGDIFSSDYGTAALKREVAMLDAAHTQGRPTAIFAHSIGPFATSGDANLMRGPLEQCALLTVRESLTQEYLATAFRLGPERAVLTADIAFLLEPSEPERASAILAGLGLENETFVTMAPSQGITTFSSIPEDAHDAAWIEAIETILKTTSYSILLIPHVQDSRPQNDDARIAFRLLEKLQFNPRLHAAFGPYGARDYKAMIARSRFLIGERMHACIAALSSGVPAITVGYSVKARGIVRDIFAEKAEDYELITPVSKFVERGQISKMIPKVDVKIAAIRALMGAGLPAIFARAKDNFDRLETLLRSAN